MKREGKRTHLSARLATSITVQGDRRRASFWSLSGPTADRPPVTRHSGPARTPLSLHSPWHPRGHAGHVPAAPGPLGLQQGPWAARCPQSHFVPAGPLSQGRAALPGQGLCLTWGPGCVPTSQASPHFPARWPHSCPGGLGTRGCTVGLGWLGGTWKGCPQDRGSQSPGTGSPKRDRRSWAAPWTAGPVTSKHQTGAGGRGDPRPLGLFPASPRSPSSSASPQAAPGLGRPRFLLTLPGPGTTQSAPVRRHRCR